MITQSRPYPKTIALTLTLILVLLLALSACGKKKEDKPEATVTPTHTPTHTPTPPSVVDSDRTPTPSDTPTPNATSTPATPAQSFASAVFAGQNTITLADGTIATYQFSLNYPVNWTAAPGATTNFLYSYAPLKFPMPSGQMAITFNFQSFMPPDLTTIEQLVPDVPTLPIVIAGYEGIRADFTDVSTATEGSTIVLQLDANAFMFITVSVSVGERASLEPVALEILDSLSVTLIQN